MTLTLMLDLGTKDKDRVIAAQREELRLKSQAIQAIVAERLSAKRSSGEGINATKMKAVKVHDPLYATVTMMVEDRLVRKMMILPVRWEDYSTNEGSFCQTALLWLGYKEKLPGGLGYKEKLPGGYESEQHLWLRVRAYVNDAMSIARNSARSRIYYRWKGKSAVSFTISGDGREY